MRLPAMVMVALAFLIFFTLLTVCSSARLYLNGTDKNGCRLGEEFQNGSCQLCPPGTYRFFAPHYISSRHPQSCKDPYALNTAVDTSNSICVKCPPGTYNPFSGAQRFRLCQPCAAGLTSGWGATKCHRCPFGESSVAGSPLCVRCTPGYRLTKPCNVGLFPDSTCTVCGEGYYTDRANSEECIKCPPGSSTTQKGTRSKSGCKICGGGSLKCSCAYEFSSRRSTELYPFFRPVGDPTCTQCPPGTAAYTEFATRLEECKPCPNGTVLDSYDYYCRKCKKGTYSFGSGAEACRAKWDGKCPETFFKDSRGLCIICGRGYRRVGGSCRKCPAGTVQNYGHETGCAKCVFPNVALPSAYGPCRCARDYFWEYKSGLCKRCPYGTVVDRDIHSESDCKPDCDRFPDAEVCTSCKMDYGRYGGKSECRKCPKGLRSVAGDDQCKDPKSGCGMNEQLLISDWRGYPAVICAKQL